ncbi:hypothetical protein GCM10009798_22770 [Nocardioides panacihumi]|uniref:Uncharacterized protein n=2 Tax=Nocardioides panacihumi TaxID=400774 RepID=A0ABN2R386_9ACTN
MLASIGVVASPAPPASAAGPVVVWAEPERSLLTDPAYQGSTAWLTLRAAVTSYDATWTLLDQASQAVLPPVPIAGNGTAYVSLSIDPEKHGVVVPAGSYTLLVTVTPTDSGVAPSTATLPITLIDDPAPTPPPAVDAVRTAVYFRGGNPAPALWRLPVYWRRPASTARLTIRSAGGDVVFDEPGNPAGCGLMDDTGCPDDPGHYRLEWDGFGRCAPPDGCPMQPAGTYTATAEMPDAYGRPIAVDLGAVRLYHDALGHRTLTVHPSSARIGEGRIVGRCSSVRSPGPKRVTGSVALLSGSRCASRTGTRDVVVQRFKVRLPRVAMFGADTLRVGVRLAGTHRDTRYRFRYSVPAAGIGWTRGSGAPASRVPDEWANAQWLAPRPVSRDLSGQDVYVEFRVANGNGVDLRAIRVDLSYYYWSLSETPPAL